jgi:ABC-type multidrug transport system ATPase subunit
VAHIKGFDVNTEISKAREHIGYCPQFDALLPLLTAREHLDFYARIKGIPEFDKEGNPLRESLIK